ncbi:MAG: flagellar assembly protein FliW [Betaproteobacteria bacterium]|jgi:flagellar assembly factor FliW|nr:flagellar assembly protein FliW [Betaproteobacteria bacterium]
MKIENPVLGAVEVSDDKVIEFPAGLPGFGNLRRFALLHEEGGEGKIFLLQSVDDASVMFSLSGPEQLGITYEFPLSDEEEKALRLSRPEDAVVAVIIRKGDEAPTSAGLRANFMAPVIINIRQQRGLQKVIDKGSCDIILRVRG